MPENSVNLVFGIIRFPRVGISLSTSEIDDRFYLSFDVTVASNVVVKSSFGTILILFVGDGAVGKNVKTLSCGKSGAFLYLEVKPNCSVGSE